ncbi:hypothetical protein [Paeniglutamicibacter cryotolerans]|uniref:hypothetical protein n=1 Tax=Paeniglutamicibacter cryotolerans TaxID=670079 RepID=UPI0016125288|nr:hypothetical protein [Paeniglutamicibacter cryotolerans]
MNEDMDGLNSSGNSSEPMNYPRLRASLPHLASAWSAHREDRRLEMFGPATTPDGLHLRLGNWLVLVPAQIASMF